MNNKYNVKYNGYFLVDGFGFNTIDQNKATVYDETSAECACKCVGRMGYVATIVSVPVTSYAVSYVRKDDLLSDGFVAANRKNPSKRRFATRDEAIQHGSRFADRKAKGSDVPGSAGHIGFYVIETFDPVNAEINWKTGLTNPLGTV